MAKSAVLSVAPEAVFLNRTEPAKRASQFPGPYSTFMIFKKRANNLSSKLRVPREPPALPTCQPFICADPKSSVACGEQPTNCARGELLAERGLPRDVADTVEAKQAKLRTQPKITVGRLGNGIDGAFGKPLADLPRRVRILTNVQRRIQRQRGRVQRQ